MSAAAVVAALLSAVVYQWTQSSKPEAPSGERSAPTVSQPAERAGAPAEAPAATSVVRAPSADAPGAALRVSDNYQQPGENFDFYLMALSLHPAFCEDGNANKRDCRIASAADNARRPLVIHGLWPENRKPEAYPRDCEGPRLHLTRELRAALDEWMPGTAAGLHSHEWRKHGTCSGLDAAAYFEESIALVRRANDVLRPTLLASIDRQVSAASLRAAADAVAPGFGASITFHCRNVRSADPGKRGRPYLIEIRQCIDNDGANGAPSTPLSCTAVGRRDQGCGAQFWIDGA
jgi:ribonuclease T2